MLWRSSSPMFGLSRDSPHTPFGGFAEFYKSTHVQIDPKISAKYGSWTEWLRGSVQGSRRHGDGAWFEFPAGMRVRATFPPPSGKLATTAERVILAPAAPRAPMQAHRRRRHPAAVDRDRRTRCRPAGAMMPNSSRWPRRMHDERGPLPDKQVAHAMMQSAAW